MKKMKIIVLLISMISLFGCGCAAGGGDPIEYDEDVVLEESIQYLADTYPDEQFEYYMMGQVGGTDYISVTFYALDSPTQLKFQVEWRENGNMDDNYQQFIDEEELIEKLKEEKQKK